MSKRDKAKFVYYDNDQPKMSVIESLNSATVRTCRQCGHNKTHATRSQRACDDCRKDKRHVR